MGSQLTCHDLCFSGAQRTSLALLSLERTLMLILTTKKSFCQKYKWGNGIWQHGLSAKAGVNKANLATNAGLRKRCPSLGRLLSAACHLLLLSEKVHPYKLLSWWPSAKATNVTKMELPLSNWSAQQQFCCFLFIKKPCEPKWSFLHLT